tara:strand:- start:9008 stop:9556 length:549 start_codon:yes stop_codon:yes gene_type:complete
MKFKKNLTYISGLIIIEPKLFEDERGIFFESFNQSEFNELLGINIKFIQDNHSISKLNVLRGMHYQAKHPQGKLIRVISGEIFDVAIDMRKSSKTFSNWFGLYLSSENKKQLWIPEGFAHGFLTISENAEVIYKVTSKRYEEDERIIRWNDPKLNIDWPNKKNLIISKKDRDGQLFCEAELN